MLENVISDKWLVYSGVDKEIETKLSIAFYLQTDKQTEYINQEAKTIPIVLCGS